MANVRSGNTYYIDTASVSLSEKNIAVVAAVVSGSGGAAILTLGDDVSGASYPNKITLQAPSGESAYFDFSQAPLLFSNGIRVKTVTTALATLFLRSQ
jgi:hypothetical protein